MDQWHNCRRQNGAFALKNALASAKHNGGSVMPQGFFAFPGNLQHVKVKMNFNESTLMNRSTLLSWSVLRFLLVCCHKLVTGYESCLNNWLLHLKGILNLLEVVKMLLINGVEGF